MKSRTGSLFLLSAVYLLLGFPMFYFVYKFGNPSFGTNDFFDYYPIYKDLNIEGVKSPFNIRLVSSFFIYLLNKMNLHYDTECMFDQLNLSKQVFFNAILFNYICVIATCVMIFKSVSKFLNNNLVAFTSGLLYLLGFGTLFYEYMPITDSFSVLVLAICFHLYLSKSRFILIPFLILIFQREYILFVFGLLALLDYFKYKARYYIGVLIMCVSCVGIYYVLRKTIFFTPANNGQVSPAYLAANFFTIKFPLAPFLRQFLMTLNIFALYLLLVGYKKYMKLNIDSYNLLKIILLFAQINVVTFAGGLGNNAGRLFYFTVPLIIFYIAKEAIPLIKKFSPEAGESPAIV